MTSAKKYASAGALRRALEDRLRQTATTEQIDLARLRRQVAFDRLLARLFHSDHVPWTLKGGYAMKLQLRVTRTTVDIDLTLPASLEEAPATAAVRERLQEAASLDLGDWFVYTVGAPMMDLDAAPYGGARYPIECRMDGRTFARIHVNFWTTSLVRRGSERFTQSWIGLGDPGLSSGLPGHPKSRLWCHHHGRHAATVSGIRYPYLCACLGVSLSVVMPRSLVMVWLLCLR
jgi:hypothetical protein